MESNRTFRDTSTGKLYNKNSIQIPCFLVMPFNLNPSVVVIQVTTFFKCKYVLAQSFSLKIRCDKQKSLYHQHLTSGNFLTNIIKNGKIEPNCNRLTRNKNIGSKPPPPSISGDFL
jgi:hypothetical protein